MVNRGPSGACERCRQRNTKCDKKRPSCSQCDRAGVRCAGYRDVGGLVFKDQSQVVIDRQCRRAARDTTTPTTSPPAIHAQPRVDVHTTSVQFFFRQYVARSPREWLLSRGHFDHLETLYRAASPDSALALATQVMAIRAMYLTFNQTLDPSYAIADENGALLALQKAISDPIDSLRDETLLAVICLDYVEHLISSKTGQRPSTAHTDGALMLIQHRRLHGFDSQITQSLVAATRSNLVLQNFWRTDAKSQEAIEQFPDVLSEFNSPVMSLHHALLRCIQLARGMPHHWKEVDDMQKTQMASRQIGSFQKLDDDLQHWSNMIPIEWRMLLGQLYALGPQPAIGQVGEPPLLQEAYFCGQFLNIRLMILKFVYVSTMNSILPESDKLRRSLATLHTVQLVLDRLFLVIAYIRNLSSYELSARVLKGQQIASILQVDTHGAGGATVNALEARLNLLNLTRWALSILTYQIPGSSGFRVEPGSMGYLVAEFRTISSVMEDVSLKTEIDD